LEGRLLTGNCNDSKATCSNPDKSESERVCIKQTTNTRADDLAIDAWDFSKSGLILACQSTNELA
jgi:hypothetical protein